MLQKIFLLLLLTFPLFSFELHSVYYIESKDITLKDIIPKVQEDVVLYKINAKKYTKKIKTKDLIEVLKKYHTKPIKTTSRYIRFIQKSPIDTSKIKSMLLNLYQDYYPSMTIKSVFIMPRGYVDSLPYDYDISINKKAHLSKESVISIKTLQNKKIFFDYKIDASLYVYFSRGRLHRNDKISTLNTIKKKIHFDKFRALPININHLNKSQSKRNVKSEKILTIRDIQTLHLVQKGSNVNVNLKNKNINISFLAKALQNGILNDIITVQKSDKQRLRVRIIGKNQVELK